jgi:hypothetical protein
MLTASILDEGYTSTFSTLFEGLYSSEGGMRWRSWLRHNATSRKVAGSIPDEVIGFFSWSNPSSRTMALGSTQPLAEMSTRNLSGGNGRPARKADSLTAICELIVQKNVGSSMSHNPGFHCLLPG